MAQYKAKPKIRDHRWDALARRFKAECRTVNALCHICVARGSDPVRCQIDYNAPRFDPYAFEADHILPAHTHPHLVLSRANLGASHSRCNRQRRDEMMHNDRVAATTKDNWIAPDW